MRLDALDAAAQGRNRAGVGAHAPLLEGLDRFLVRRGEPEAGSFVHDMF
jgi:hypothetical protein